MFVACLIFPRNAKTPKKHSYRFLFSYVLLFSRFYLKLVWTKKNARVFSKCFLSNISLVDPKSLRFSLLSLIFGHKIGWRKAKRSSDDLNPRLRFVRNKSRIDIWKTLAKSDNSLHLPEVNTIFNSFSSRNASNMLSLTAIRVVS